MRFAIIIIFVITFILSTLFVFIKNKQKDITIGLLYSKTGTMSVEESAIAKMLYYGVKEINSNGGINGRKVTIIEYDGKSDSKEFAKGAKTLLEQNVKYIFGSWTSASRKAVKPIVEENGGLLFYPVQYEGAEKSDNIIYLGVTPNQQINPTITYIKKKYGDNIYIVGSDYIYPRMTSVYIESLAKNIKLNIVGESYHLLGSEDFLQTVKEIQKLKPDAIINTLNGTSNIAFFKALYENNISAKQIPVFSMSIDENSLQNISSQIGSKAIDGHFATWNYFNSIDTQANRDFKKQLSSVYSENFILTNASYNIYLALKFWEKALMSSKDQTIQNITRQIKRASLSSLGGIVYIDKLNNHTHKKIRIGMIHSDKFDIVWESENLTHPQPYINFESISYWDEKVKSFYKIWNNSWQAPAKGKIDE